MKKTVLIVEQGELAQKLAGWVAKEGFDVFIVPDYEAAQRIALRDELEYALAIVAMDGIEPGVEALMDFVQALRKHNPNMEILIMAPEGQWYNFSELQVVTTQKTAAGYADLVTTLRRVGSAPDINQFMQSAEPEESAETNRRFEGQLAGLRQHFRARALELASCSTEEKLINREKLSGEVWTYAFTQSLFRPSEKETDHFCKKLFSSGQKEDVAIVLPETTAEEWRGRAILEVLQMFDSGGKPTV